MICPECRAEYRPGFTRCSDCGVELVESLPEDESATREPIGHDLVQVYRAWGAPQAELVRSILEANGIRPALFGEGANRVYNMTVGPLAEVRIMVERDDAAAAGDILRAADSGKFSLED